MSDSLILHGLWPARLLHTYHLFMYLFLAILDLHCCVLALSSCGELGPLSVAVPGLPVVVASLVVEHGL